MIKNIFIIFSLWLYTVPSLCQYHREEHEWNQDFLDSASVSKLFMLSHEDSLLVHLPDATSAHYYGEIFDETKILAVSASISPYYIRSVISVYGNPENGYLGSYIILYTNGLRRESIKRIQRDSCDVERGMLSGFEPAITFVDFNHDGFKDIIISFSENTTGRRGPNHFWTFDSVKCNFVKDTSMNLFQDLDISIDDDATGISEGGRIGCCGYEISTYHWNGKTYELFSEESAEQNEHGHLIRLRKEIINGQWRIVECDTTK